MKTAILSLLTAGTLALTPMAATPSQAADAGDVLGAVVGIAALAAIANSIDNGRNDNLRETNRGQIDFFNGKRGVRGVPHRRNARVLPSRCLRVLDGQRRNTIVFPERCLNRNGVSDRALPLRCERQVRTSRGRLDVFGARCLANHGWQLPRIATR